MSQWCSFADTAFDVWENEPLLDNPAPSPMADPMQASSDHDAQNAGAGKSNSCTSDEERGCGHGSRSAPVHEVGGGRETTESGGVPTSAPSNRPYLTLLLASLLSVGAHVCYKMTSSIENDLIASLGINNQEYGELNAAVSWASFACIPFAAGVAVDRFPTRYAAVLFSAIVFLGQLIFALGVRSKSFPIAMLGRAVFGVGESTIMVAQGALVCQWFRSREQLALAIGVTETTHNLGNLLGKVSIHVGLAWGSWEATVWFGVGICVFSLLASVVYFFLEINTDPSEFIARKITLRCSELGGLRKLSVQFWILCFLHFLVSNVEHLFDAISADFIFQKWHITWNNAVWLSGLNYVLPVVLSPAVGHMLDRVNNRMTIAALACAIMAAGHFILGFRPWTPVVGMLTLAVAESLLPTILRSCVPLVVPHSVAGVAFGIYAVAENFGKVVGNPLVGWVKDTTGSYIIDQLIFIGMSCLSVLLCFVIAALDWGQKRAIVRHATTSSAAAAEESTWGEGRGDC